MSNSVWPHRRQPTRLPRPWDSPGKNTGEGCHFLLQCMKVKSESEVAQSCPTLCNTIDCSLPGSSVHGIFKTRILEYIAIFSSRGYSQPRDGTLISCVSCIGRKDLYHWLHLRQLYFKYIHIYFKNPVSETAKETLRYRTVFWTLWERERVGWFGRMALKHV